MRASPKRSVQEARDHVVQRLRVVSQVDHRRYRLPRAQAGVRRQGRGRQPEDPRGQEKQQSAESHPRPRPDREELEPRPAGDLQLLHPERPARFLPSQPSHRQKRRNHLGRGPSWLLVGRRLSGGRRRQTQRRTAAEWPLRRPRAAVESQRAPPLRERAAHGNPESLAAHVQVPVVHRHHGSPMASIRGGCLGDSDGPRH